MNSFIKMANNKYVGIVYLPGEAIDQILLNPVDCLFVDCSGTVEYPIELHITMFDGVSMRLPFKILTNAFRFWERYAKYSSPKRKNKIT